MNAPFIRIFLMNESFIRAGAEEAGNDEWGYGDETDIMLPLWVMPM
jgi:hypothetical protein